MIIRVSKILLISFKPAVLAGTQTVAFWGFQPSSYPTLLSRRLPDSHCESCRASTQSGYWNSVLRRQGMVGMHVAHISAPYILHCPINFSYKT